MRCVWQALRSPHAVPASSLLGTASPSHMIDFLSGVTAISLLVSHPGSQLLKLTLLQNFGLSLTLCAASAWPFVALRQPLCESYWITLCLSLLMILWMRKSLSLSLSLQMLSLPLNCKKSPRSELPPENFSLQKFDRLISRCVLQVPIKPSLIILSLINQRPILDHNQWLGSY